MIQKALRRDKLFNKAYQAQRRTTGGRKFTQVLKSQNKTNVLYVPFTKGFASGINEQVGSKREFNNLVDSYGVLINKNEYNKISEDGKKNIQIIGLSIDTNKNRKEVSNEQAFGLATTMNHEEVAHATSDLEGIEKTNAEGHKEYFNENRNTSPEDANILTDKKYEGTKARQQFEELKKIIYEKEKPNL